MKSSPEILNIGFNNIVFKKRIISIVGADAAPVKRLREHAREENKLIDATNGKKTKSVIIADSMHVILCALSPETLSLRVEGNSESKKK
ncbi:MAG: extracellular matrix/biofilm biosynthesis regulator RemA family protein [Candidatus Omnitrophota bacterium]